MPIFQENTSNPIRGILVIALLWLSTGAMHLYSQVPSYVPTNGLVGWWPFNGNANDESGNNFSLTNNFVQFSNDFERGCVANFNGNAWLQSATSIFQSQSPKTISFWAKTSISTAMDVVSQACGNDCGDDIRVQLNAAQCGYTGLSFKSPAHFATAPGVVSNLKWHHYTLVMGENNNYSYSNFKFYIDGTLVAIGPSQCRHNWGGWTYNPNSNYTFNIGKGGPLGSNYKGKLDDVTIWNRALNQSEISAIYNAPSSASCSASIITQDTTICLGSSVTLRAPALTTTTVPSAGNCSNGIGTWEQLFTSTQLSGYSINRTNGYAFDTATGIYYSVSGSTTLKLDLVNKTITPFTQSGQNSSFSHGIFNYLDQKLYAHRVGRDVVYNVPKAGGTWTVYGSGSFDANSYGSQPFYDAQNNRVGFFGGYGFYSVKNWVYESTSTGWVNPYANNNNCNPARRNATGIAPSKDYKKMYIFSGAGNCNGSQTATSCTLGQAWASDVGKWCWLQDLYEYDFTTHSFTTILPTASPSISQEGSFAYNFDTDVFYILGGFTPPATYSATWGNTAPYTNTVLMMDRGAGATSFSQVSICGTPPPVGTVSSSQGMAFYDGPRDRIIWMRPDGIWALNLNTSTTSTTSSRLWSTGDTAQSITVTPSQTTTYWLSNSLNGTNYTDSVTVFVNNPLVFTANSNVCLPGDSVLLWTGNSASTSPALTCNGPNGILRNGLIGWWPFCGNAIDESGNGFNGTVNGAVLTHDRFGNPNSAYSFDGVNDFIQIPLLTPLNGVNELTLNAWIFKPDNQLGTYFGHWLSTSQPTSSVGVTQTINSNSKLGIAMVGGAGTVSNTALTLGSWQNVSVVFNGLNPSGSRLALFVNGDFVEYIPDNGIPTSTGTIANKTYIGANSAFFNVVYQYFKGSIDDIAIWNRSLSSNEIKQFYNSSISKSILWSNGETTDSIWVKPTSTTTYWVQQTINGVTCTDSITISVSGTHISASDTVVCAGSPVTLTAGGSVQFNGSSGFISFPNAGPTGQSPRSFSMWFKTNSTSEMDLLGYGTRSCTQALELKLNDNLNYSASYNNSPCTLLQGVSTNFECHGSNWSANVSDDQWHHVVYVLGENGNYSYSNIKAYLDGVLISTNPGCFHNWGGWTYNTGAASPMVIGKRFDGNQHFFNGTIDEVSIWNSALNSSQVGGIYQNGVVPTDPNLAHYYDFNDIANGQVPDLVGSNHGTIQGGASQSGLQAGTGARSFLWSTGDTTSSITVNPAQTTTYWLTTTSNGISCSDSIQIIVLDVQIGASAATICAPGDSVLLYTSANNSTVYDTSYVPGALINQVTKTVTQNWQVDWPVSAGSWHFLEVSGMYNFTTCVNERDAAYWTNVGCNASKSSTPYNLHCNGGFASWWIADSCNQRPENDVYSPQHTYLYRVRAHDGSLTLKFYDDYFGDNGGQLTFKLFQATPTFVPRVDSSLYWSTGQYNDSIWVTPNQTTTYWVQSTINGVVCTDSATITVSTAQIAPIDSVICLGESVLLTAIDSTLGSYQWSTGDTIAWITVQPSQTTKYWLTTLKNGQTCSDTVTIYVNNIGLQTSTSFVCEPGDSVLIWTNSNAQNLTSNTCFPPGATLKNGLLAWYPFCGNANDASGNGNHAQVFGATLASDRFGTPQSAYDFDGIDDHLRAAVTNLPKGNSARSFAGWIYSDGTNASGGSGTIYHHGAISYRQRDCMLQWNNQTFSHIGEGYDFGGGSLPQGSWQHVAFTHDGTTARLYVNGALRAQSNRNYNTAVGDLFLGFNSNSGHFNGERFNGRIDDFGAWNRVLSAQEVQQLVTTDGNQTLWSNSSTSDSIWVAPTQTTTYTVQKTSMGQTCTDSVTIFVASARIQASDTAICSGGSTTLTASYNGLGQTYLWSTGDTTSQIIVAPVTTSIYSLTTTLSNGLQCVDSVRIHVNNAQITASDTVICSAGDSVLLWVPYQNAGIIPGSWGTGQSSFYSTNFNSGIDPGWSSPTGPMPYSGNRVGPFGAGTLQLNLNNLPCHDSLRFNGILQLTGTWDGNGNHCCGPDIFNIIVDGSTVFSTTFTLTQWAGNFQSYPSQYNPSNLVNNAQGTGSIANNTYLLSFNFPHSSGAIEFKLAQPASQGAADEAWYFDDFNLELFECGAGGSSIWSTGQGGDSIWVKPQQTTKYWVKRWMQGIVCSDTITVHVSNLQQNFDPLPDTLVVCNGLSTLVHVGPGFTSYQWNDATTDSVKTINATGTYWVTVTDSLGCQASDTIWVYFSDLGASITKLNDVFCFGGNNGAILLTTFGGQPPYSITWSTGQTGISGLANLGAGVYWVTVTDALGCLRRDTIAVGQPIAPLSVIVAVNNVSCFAGATGSLTSVVSGGTAPYTYSWNTVPAQTSPTASNLPAGSYTLFITDANGCNLTVSGVITQPAAPLSASVSGTNVLCFGGTTGTANVVASGGTAPYSYSWNTSPAQTTSAATNLASGTYTVTIIDSKNCQTTQSVTITQPSAPLSGTISTTTVNCYGGSNGSATVTPSGGTGPYNFIWTTVPAQTSATASNLPAGTHTVLITDANNCSVTRTATVTQPASALAITSTFTPVLCFGDATGTATVLATGGTAPYSYQWTSIPGLTSNSATNLSVGAYVVVVTDAKGCTQQASIAVTQPSAPLSGTLSVTDVACFGNATGSITANINGGTAPYSYSWSSIPGLTSNSASGLTAGTYAVSATDANGCTYSLSGTIAQPLAPLQATSSGQDALCFGAASGFAQVAPSGGTAPYSFNWNTVPVQTTPVASNLTAGTYTCTVTDANGCVQFGVWTVGQPMPLMGTSVVNDVSCGRAQDGSIQVSISGGTGNYSISWPNGSNSLNRYQLGPGTYSYTITDENNCSFIGTATVNEPDPFRVTVDTVSPKCNSTEDGRITIMATGGNGMLTYYINGDVFNGMADGLGVFPYGITIMDQNGCDTSFVVDLSPVYEPCVEIPNWFSPNGNGENDLWVIQGFELEALKLVVFNVWGQIIYQTDSDNYIPWDGTYEGVSLPNGDYYYVMTSRNEHKYYSGYVTILR